MEKQMGFEPVTAKQAMEYYDTHTNEFAIPESIDVSHILIKMSPEASTATQQVIVAKLKEVKKKIMDGMSFGDAAKKYSECPTGKMAGDVGQISINDDTISAPFSKAAFALPVSNVSDVVKSEFGAHLIYVTQKNAANTASFSEVETKLVDYMNQIKKRNLAEEWTIDLRSKADVKYK